MSSCADVVTRAYRLAGFVPLAGVPTAGEAEFGLDALKGLFAAWAVGGLFGRLTDTLTSVNYTALEQERVIASSGATITVPATYACDGSAGDDRPPYDLSLIEVQDGTTRNVWLYDHKAWVDLAALTSGGDCPLAETRGVNGLAACLALEIAGPNANVPATVGRSAALFRQSLSYKSGSARPARVVEYY